MNNMKASYTKIEQRRLSSGEIISNNLQASSSSAVRRRSSIAVATPASSRSADIVRTAVYEPISLQQQQQPSEDVDDNNDSEINDTDFCIDDNDKFYHHHPSSNILEKYPAYRVYLLSHMCQNLGDWFVRIASILIVEELASAAASTSDNNNNNGTGKALSYVTLARLIPNAIFAQVGGILADRFDRRHIMICIDILSGIVVLGYLIAIQYQSLNMFYIITSIRSALSATYYPATQGIVPLLVHGNPHDLQMAVTMNSWAWGLCAIIGGLLAGSIASIFGLQACYLIDLITYWTSATVIAIYIKGNFKVAGDDHNNTASYNDIDDQKGDNLSTMAAIAVGGGYQPTSSTGDDETIIMDDGLSSINENDNNSNNINMGNHNHNHSNKNNSNNCNSSPIKKVYGEIRDLFTYLSTCGFGMMIFLKSSASFVWGIEDIVGAQFSTVFRDDGTEDEQLSSIHMGTLFFVIGIGCMTGPALLNLITDARQPYTLQRACWIGLLFLTGGWLIISLVQTFPQFLMGTFIRTMGAGAVWVNSAIILQTLSDPKILGRMLATEYTLTTLFEATSCAVTGRLSVDGFSKNMLALFGAFLGILMLIVWGIYYSLSLGAADPRFNNNYQFRGNNDNSTMVVEEKEVEMVGDVIFDSNSNNNKGNTGKSQKIIVFV
ncbi:major facilitator superfamily transporter [Fragilariopsis cylindrus CCMP1102]|uniref:Major facilitator superfamily transporter n=1 Tax=Fragilariopsis cylindrus CCMP1102 TaxID=635003 RepID=A0A1E7F0T3_9STRA|nr:major facilitator superfamily transporter [Fragilariopsis cylindrus CCMP1102]|eukprot:OEU11694.1 major facilitator superfamily transporter [Fragilariopsis cylindrus CCMP1102]